MKERGWIALCALALAVLAVMNLPEWATVRVKGAIRDGIATDEKEREETDLNAEPAPAPAPAPAEEEAAPVSDEEYLRTLQQTEPPAPVFYAVSAAFFKKE